jgi:hypothetical protein
LGKPGQQEQKMNDEIMKQTTPLTKKAATGKKNIIPANTAANISPSTSGVTPRQVEHIRLPQRSDAVEGKESDVASLKPSENSDPRTVSQDPIHDAVSLRTPRPVPSVDQKAS